VSIPACCTTACLSCLLLAVRSTQPYSLRVSTT